MKLENKLLASLALCPAILVAGLASAQVPTQQIVRDRIIVAPRPLSDVTSAKLPTRTRSIFNEIAVIVSGGDADPRLVSGGFIRQRGPLNGVLVPANFGAYDR